MPNYTDCQFFALSISKSHTLSLPFFSLRPAVAPVEMNESFVNGFTHKAVSLLLIWLFQIHSVLKHPFLLLLLLYDLLFI